ncbi:UNVERIFIED_CONTAM: hypothetical protein FKN15_076794 [Acipenser sinensis]
MVQITKITIYKILANIFNELERVCPFYNTNFNSCYSRLNTELNQGMMCSCGLQIHK